MRKRPGRPPEPLESRFWCKVQKAEDDNCWLWTGTKNSGGYGIIAVSVTTPTGRTAWYFEIASRLAYTMAHGAIPPGVYVLHSCDTPACVRPSHLRLGDAAENVADMKLRGRIPRGANRAHAKLSDEAVRAMRRVYATEPDASYGCVAQRFGVTPAAAASAIRGDTWKDVDEPAPRRSAGGRRRAKLSAEAVAAIGDRLARSTDPILKIALEYGVSPPTIQAIRQGYAWSDVLRAAGLLNVEGRIARPMPQPTDSGPVCRRCLIRPKSRTHRWCMTCQRESRRARRRVANAIDRRRKLDTAAVRAIRERYEAGGITMLRLALEFGVTQTTVQQLVRRRSWREVT